jgi:hypothetical protein
MARTDQPDQVVTEETARAPDEHVVTSDANFNSDASPAEPAPSAAADKDGPTASESDTDKPKKAPPKRNRSAERRIKKLGDKLSAAEARDADNANRIAELEGQVESLTAATPKSKEPRLNDFDNPREYAKAYSKWEAEGAPAPKPKPKAKPKPAATTDPAPADAPTPHQDSEILGFKERGQKKLGDEFIEALGEKTAVNQLMGEFMLDHDLGPEIYVHLANNPEEAKKIYDSSVPRQTKAMEALATRGAKGGLDVGEEGELQVETPPANPADDDYEDPGHEPPKVTKAPEPPSDTNTGGDADVPVNPENESMEDYAARRRKEEARKAGAII